MMLRLQREPTKDGETLGRLFVDGTFECHTLEDAIRSGPKLAHETAIPPGKYRVSITASLRFARMLPLLHGVLGFEGVRIHNGNTTHDTSGCILVGDTRTRDIGSSRKALDRLQPKIAAALASGDQVWIEVENPAQVVATRAPYRRRSAR